MSTRGWYEYYVINEKSKELSLALQFYKWGDAVPENAIDELQIFEGILKDLGKKLPIYLLDNMLKENLDDSYIHLPKYFSIACYFFFLQRAQEELSPIKYMFRRLNKDSDDNDPLSELVRLVKYVSDRKKYKIEMGTNNVANLAHIFIASGAVLKRWPPFSLRWTFLRWIHYLTEVKDVIDMGSIACDYRITGDESYIYRFFFYIPDQFLEQEQPIEKISLEICDRSGNELLTELQAQIESEKNEENKEDLKKELTGIKKLIEDSKPELFSLSVALNLYTWCYPSLFQDKVDKSRLKYSLTLPEPKDSLEEL